jgi:flagellar biosynthetic protein FliQ
LEFDIGLLSGQFCNDIKEFTMDTSTVVDLGRQALWMTVIISAPLLGVALLVGLVIGILQAATSINEMTLSFIPKLAALAVTIAIVGGWQLTTLVDYTRSIFQRIPGLFA